MIITINTKHKSGKWTCYATIRGMDYSFSHCTKWMAQTQMLCKLSELNCEEYEFERTVFYWPDKAIPQAEIRYQKSRIDNNPIG